LTNMCKSNQKAAVNWFTWVLPSILKSWFWTVNWLESTGAADDEEAFNLKEPSDSTLRFSNLAIPEVVEIGDDEERVPEGSKDKEIE